MAECTDFADQSEFAQIRQTSWMETSAELLRKLHRNTIIKLCDQENDSQQAKLWASTTSMRLLNKTYLKNLYLGEPARGQFLQLRTLESAKKVNGMTTVVEDELGQIVMFCAYNYTASFEPDYDDIFPCGTVFLLKEPYMNVSMEGHCYLRCDCPSEICIVFLTKQVRWKNDINLDLNPTWRRPIPNTVQEWEQRGTQLFDTGKFEQAAIAFLISLEKNKASKDVNMKKKLCLKLSEAYFEAEYFENAMFNAVEVLRIDNMNKTSLRIIGRSWFRLRRHERALQALTKCYELDPTDMNVKMELEKIQECLLGTQKGKFAMQKYASNQKHNPGELQNCGNFVGPIKAEVILGKGRGIFATKNILPGTLLMVSKALAFSWNADVKPAPGDVFRTGSRQHLVAQLVQLICKNPFVYGEIINNLSDGKVTFRMGPSRAFCGLKTEMEMITDVGQIRAIVYNCILGTESESQDLQFQYAMKNGCGIFEGPSMFNHSCLPNAAANNFGDVLFVRASDFIKKGEEIFLSFVPCELPYPDRLELCWSRRFLCDCRLCQIDQAALGL